MKTVKLCSGHPVLLTCVASSKEADAGGWEEPCQPGQVQRWPYPGARFPPHSPGAAPESGSGGGGGDHVSPAYSSRIRLICDRKGEGLVQTGQGTRRNAVTGDETGRPDLGWGVVNGDR